ncbi:MAG TPA: diguanylate cyclase, partial [Arenimonas sp.]|nr:diguanylate cyclase [Arenimonas sp.]
GLIWAGGYGGGVQRHNTGNTAFRVRGPEGPVGGVLQDANFRAVLELADGRLWLGTQENGVAILDADLHLLDAIRPQPERADGLGAGRVTGLAQTRDGRVWLGGDAGLYRYDLTTGRLRAYRAGQGRARRLLADPNGDLWIATEDGLFRHSYRADRIERLSAENGDPVSGDINALALDSAGRLWVGTENGLAVLEAGATHLRRLRNDSGTGLRHALVLGLLIDSKDQLWVDTPEGLHRMTAFDGAQAEFDAVSLRLGIAGRPFGANLLEDDNGRIWTHLFVFDPASGEVHELTQADGVDIGTGWFRAYQRSRDGRLLFGGSRGLLVVDPARFRPSNYAPPLVVTELKVDGESVAPGLFEQGLSLHPGQRSFSVEFSALDFSAPERCLYQYRLQGYDSRWNDTDANFRVAAYSNLAPGQYRLEIRGSNRSGEWNPQALALDIRVLPAWWQHWLFRSAMVVLASLMVWLLVHLRTRYLHQRRQLLEVKVAARTAELEAVSQALQEKSLALEEASVTDPLTGLRNRRFLSQHIDTDIALSIRQHEAQLRLGHAAVGCDLIFFMIDIDHFKQVNDLHGHSAGDAVLVQMTERLRLVFRDSDYLIRWGGEEFLIVARATDRSYATILAERARRQVAEHAFVIGDGLTLAKTCSIGFAGFPLQPEHPRALAWGDVVDVVDLALYAAKRAGRDGWVGLQTTPGSAIGGEIKRRLPTLLREDRIRVLSSLPIDSVLAGLGDPDAG